MVVIDTEKSLKQSINP